MYKVNQTNRNAVAIVAAFLIIISIVAYMAINTVMSLKAAFSTRTANDSVIQEIYKK